MSEDHAVFPNVMAPPVEQAREFLQLRGQELPTAALRLLAREVILRVSQAAGLVSDRTDAPDQLAINRLCDALLSADDAAGADLVRTARLGGMRANTLYHHYIAGAVRQFGERWDRDQTTAAQVILGAGRVYAILRELRAVFLAEQLVAPRGAEAVFATVPGEVHGLGMTMAADAMRLKGWDIAVRPGLGHSALVDEVAKLRPTMVGLSISHPGNILATARLIVALRVCCPEVWIILGGPLIAQDPEIAKVVDADASAISIDDGAVRLAEHLEDLNRLRRAVG